MNDNETAMPAGDGVINEDAAADLIMGNLMQEPEDDEQSQAGDDTSRAEVEAEPEVEAQAETEDEGEEATDSREEEAETEEAEYVDFEKIHPDTQIRLRDGSVKRFGDIKRDWAELQDFNRQRQEFSQHTQAFQQQAAQIAQQQQYLQQVLPRAIQTLQASLPEVLPMPSPELAKTDVFAYNEQLAAHLQSKEIRAQREQQLHQFEHAQRAQIEQAQRQQTEQRRAYLQTEQKKLLDALPVLRDEKARQGFDTDYRKYGKEVYGFSDQELSQVADHRLILLVRDAIEFRKLQSRKPMAAEKVKDAPPVRKPGKRASEADQKARTEAEKMQRLRKTGSMEDAVDLLLNG